MIADINVVVKKIRESSNAFKKVTATDVVNFADIKASDEDKKTVIAIVHAIVRIVFCIN